MDHVSIIERASNADIADWVAARLDTALAMADGKLAIALPGGATPFPILDLLLAKPLAWHRLQVFPTDDRLVAEDHPASNTGKLRALFAPVGAQVCALDDAALPEWFALVWLGMGGDGHVASLFPNTDPRADEPRRVVKLVPDPLPPEAPFARLSLTIPALLNSDAVVFVIRGADKRAVFQAALSGEHDLPVARLLAAADQPVLCFT